MPAHNLCAYLPAERAVRATGPATVQDGFALVPMTMPVPVARGRLASAPVNTGPPAIAASSSNLVLKV
jgi:hypothetical protein